MPGYLPPLWILRLARSRNEAPHAHRCRSHILTVDIPKGCNLNYNDRRLGMNRDISRRDFMNGAALAAGSLALFDRQTFGRDRLVAPTAAASGRRSPKTSSAICRYRRAQRAICYACRIPISRITCPDCPPRRRKVGVSALGVPLFARDRYPQKYPQHSLAGKSRRNRIKHLRPRHFGAAERNRTAARALDLKWQTRAQLHTRK